MRTPTVAGSQPHWPSILWGLVTSALPTTGPPGLERNVTGFAVN